MRWLKLKSVPVKLFAICFLTLSFNTALGQTDKATQLKSVFVYNFLKFVQWPEDGSQKDYTILILGNTNIYDYLMEISRIKTINGRHIKVSKIESSDQYEFCHILFISEDKYKEFFSLKNSLKEQPVLTISDCSKLSGKGLGFYLYEDGGRIKLETDPIIFSFNKLRVSSQLLKLAHIRTTK